MWQSISKNFRIIIISSLLLVGILLYQWFSSSVTTLTPRAYQRLLEEGLIDRVMVEEPYLYLYTDEGEYRIAKEAVNMDTLFEKSIVEYREEPLPILDLMLLIFIMLFSLYIFRVIRKHQAQNEEFLVESPDETQQGALQTITPQISTVNFADVAGIEEVKEELEEIIDFLRHPLKYRNFDIRLPKGVLLIGPPGVGKTMIAKAVAGEAGVPFFYQSAASFVHIYVGMGAKRVSELFKRAKEMAPSIIFIDEIDAVGKSRGGSNNDERESTLNQLLTEMDGFEESSGVMVIAATNKIEVLDEALLRSGRFDRRIHIPLPNFKERCSTLELYFKEKRHRVDIEKVAHMTIGFNSAALATLVNESALYALRMGKEMIETSDVEATKDKVLFGKHKIKTLNEQEQEIQALYQAAKAVTATWLEVDYEKMGLVSSNLIPHHGEILSQTILENQLKVLLSGRIMTQRRYHELFTNAKEDIHQAKQLVEQIIEEFVMANEYFSSVTHRERLLQTATAEVDSLLNQLDPVISQVERYLLENESITPAETKRILDAIF